MRVAVSGAPSASALSGLKRGERIPSKNDTYLREETVSSTNQFPKIPKDSECMTERSNNPCRASQYVKHLKKFYGKMVTKSALCPSCSNNRKVKDLDRKKILNPMKHKTLKAKLCIVASHNQCQRMKQIHKWIINCKFKLNSMKNCNTHSKILKNEQKKQNTKLTVLTLILNE